jgi:hypothetical protein
LRSSVAKLELEMFTVSDFRLADGQRSRAGLPNGCWIVWLQRQAEAHWRRESVRKVIPILTNNVTLNRVFFRLAALFVVAIARYGSFSRLARRKNPSISLSRY